MPIRGFALLCWLCLFFYGVTTFYGNVMTFYGGCVSLEPVEETQATQRSVGVAVRSFFLAWPVTVLAMPESHLKVSDLNVGRCVGALWEAKGDCPMNKLVLAIKVGECATSGQDMGQCLMSKLEGCGSAIQQVEDKCR